MQRSPKQKVWPLDLEDAHHTNYGVESVQSVAQRLRGMFLHLEEEHAPGTPILLTSHADTLQVLAVYVCVVLKKKKETKWSYVQEDDSWSTH